MSTFEIKSGMRDTKYGSGDHSEAHLPSVVDVYLDRGGLVKPELRDGKDEENGSEPKLVVLSNGSPGARSIRSSEEAAGNAATQNFEKDQQKR